MAESETWTDWTLAEAWPRMQLFLDKFRNSGNVRMACRSAKIPRSTAYYWRNKYKTFRKAWDEAKEDACDILEGKAWKIAVEDENERMIMFLLKAHRREVYGDQVDVTTGGEPVNIAVHEVIVELPTDEPVEPGGD